MNHTLVILLLAALAVTSAAHAGPEPPRPGDLLWASAFDRPATAGDGSGRVVAGAGHDHALEISNRDAPGAVTRAFVLPVEKLRGRVVILSADVRAEGVSAKPQSWNGIKVMAHIEAPSKESWPQPDIETGSFGWRRVSQRILVPPDASAVTLALGLEKVTGTAWFDNVRLTYAKTITTAPAAPPTQPIFTGHNLPRLRGAMVAPDTLTESALQTFATEWNGNLVRWQLIRSNVPEGADSPAAYDLWMEAQLQRLDKALAWAKAMGVMVVVDLHSPPGGKNSGGGYQAAMGGIFSDPTAQAKFVEVWRAIAQRYKGEAQIWGFDLLNEPVEDGLADGCDDWEGLALRAGQAIRKIDPERTLIVESAQWGSPAGFVNFQPLPLPRVVYSVHMYEPSAFTHQWVFSESAPVHYPGLIAGATWDRAALEHALAPVIDFARRYRVQIYVGEFSAIRWAPGAEAYLADLTSLFEAHGWDWSYHAYREWSGWSLEAGSDRADAKPSAAPNPRKEVILHWFKQNRRAVVAPKLGH